MEKIKVLCLNDDNHSKSYITKSRYFNNAADFMKNCLLLPHDEEYEVREVYICNPQGELADLNEDEFLYMFDLLDLTHHLDEIDNDVFRNREIAFDLFWENADEWQYA